MSAFSRDLSDVRETDARVLRVRRLAAAMGPCSSVVDRERHLAYVLRTMLRDPLGARLVVLPPWEEAA